MQTASEFAPFVLVAEDNPDDRLLLQFAFKSAHLPNPYQIVNDGAEAIAWLQKQIDGERPTAPRVELLVVDIHMPNKSGLDVLEWVRGQDSLRELPVVVLSGLCSPHTVERALALGARSYLFKAGDYGELAKF